MRSPETPRRRRVGVLLAVAAFVYVADVVTKVVVVAAHLSPLHPIRVLGGFLQLTLVRNSGAAFSLGTSMTAVFTLIAAGVIVFILRASRRLHSVPWAVTLGLLLGGATGNLTDRILRAPGVFRGDVVDWIQLPHWPVFNLADSAIVCGGALAVLLAARGIRLDGAGDGESGAVPPGQAGAGRDRRLDPGADGSSRGGPGGSAGGGPDSGQDSSPDGSATADGDHAGPAGPGVAAADAGFRPTGDSRAHTDLT